MRELHSSGRAVRERCLLAPRCLRLASRAARARLRVKRLPRERGGVLEDLRHERAQFLTCCTEHASLSCDAPRNPGSAPAVLRAHEYRCAGCAYDGQVGKISVGIEAAHVKWFSHGGPDVIENGLSLCSLHHKAFDLGAIAISDDHKVLVSRDFRVAERGGSPACGPTRVHR